MLSNSMSNTVEIKIQGELKFPGQALATFRQKHPEWFSPLESQGPVYRLPPRAIEGMKKPPRGQQPIVSAKEADMETAFSELCESCRAIGVWNEAWVCPSYLIRPEPLSEDMLEGLNWTRKEILAAISGVQKSDAMVYRLKGYAGWLITEPKFLHDRDKLASRWKALPAQERPYPIRRSVRIGTPPKEVRRASSELAGFQKDLNGFLDLWGLTGMSTWDLPEPQGPLLPAPVGVDSPAMPKHGLHLVLPIHYPLTGTDDLLKQIRQQQVELARELGLDTSMAGLPHHEAYGQMLEVHLLELTIRSRYGKPRRPGLVTVMEAAIAETLCRSVDQVKKLRKAISACRSGKRSSVSWLRSRD